ncbi:MAG: response regulator transcription factor [Clostridia bacterium]|nr:response regulator transcription factor [Clostridia bacterium]
MIWCVEDDEGILDIEVYTLKSTGFEAEGFKDGAQMLQALESRLPELIILDIMLPEIDGVTLLKRLKEDARTQDIPIIMATAKGQEYDKIQSLDLGADDYLTKPFGMMEMVSRVKAVLRRCTGNKRYELKFGEITLDLEAHTAYVNDERVDLTLKEYELLKVLMSRIGMVFTRDKLLSDIWGMDYDGETRTVDVHIRTLRQKLGAAGDSIQTVRGLGYRMEARP